VAYIIGPSANSSILVPYMDATGPSTTLFDDTTRPAFAIGSPVRFRWIVPQGYTKASFGLYFHGYMGATSGVKHQLIDTILLADWVSAGTVNLAGTLPWQEVDGTGAVIASGNVWDIYYVDRTIDSIVAGPGGIVPEGLYSICLDQNGRHYNELQINNDTQFYHDAGFRLTPGSHKYYDDLPERTEINTRTAGEKAIYEDEYVTLDQIEAGRGILLKYRNEDGTLAGYPEVAPDPKGFNLVLEADGAPIFAQHNPWGTPAYNNPAGSVSPYFIQNTVYRDTSTVRWTLNDGGGSSTIGGYPIGRSASVIAQHIVGFTVQTDDNIFTPNVAEPAFLDVDSSERMKSLNITSRRVGGVYPWFNVSSTEYARHLAVLWRETSQGQNKIIEAYVQNNKMNIVYEDFTGSEPYQVGIDPLSSTQSASRYDNNQILAFERLSAFDGAKTPPVSDPHNEEFGIVRIGDVWANPLYALPGDGDERLGVGFGIRRNPFFNEENKQAPTFTLENAWYGGALAPNSTAPYVQFGTTSINVPLTKGTNDGIRTRQYSDEFEVRNGVAVFPKRKGMYSVNIMTAGESVNDGAGAYPQARYDTFLRVIRSGVPLDLLDADSHIDWDNTAPNSLLDSMPWSLQGSFHIWLNAGDWMLFELLLKGAGGWTNARARAFYLRYLYMDMQWIHDSYESYVIKKKDSNWQGQVTSDWIGFKLDL